MGRPLRADAPGLYAHISATGVARRTIFEIVRDVRKLLALLAKSVQDQHIEVLVFAVLMTHFHLLIRSVDGTLSATMQRILDAFARYFNRTRLREGHVFGGRFFSKVVETASYFETVVYYIDENAVEAGLAEDPTEYAFGSARYYAQGRGPIWLSMDIVRSMVAEAAGTGIYVPETYVETAKRGSPEFRRRLVERRLTRECLEPDPLDTLLICPRHGVIDWMQERARLADGKPALPGLLLADSATLLSHLEVPSGANLVEEAKRRGDRDLISLAIGLLRTVGGCTVEEIGQRLGVSKTTITKRSGKHGELVLADSDYAQRAAEILQLSLRDDHPQPHLPRKLFLPRETAPATDADR